MLQMNQDVLEHNKVVLLLQLLVLFTNENLFNTILSYVDI